MKYIPTFEQFINESKLINEKSKKDIVNPNEVVTKAVELRDNYREFKKLERKYGFELKKTAFGNNTYYITMSKLDFYNFYTTDYPRIMFPELFKGNKNEKITIELHIPSAHRIIRTGLSKYGLSFSQPEWSNEIGGYLYNVKGERNKLLQFVTTEYLEILHYRLFHQMPIEAIDNLNEAARVGRHSWRSILKDLRHEGWEIDGDYATQYFGDGQEIEITLGNMDEIEYEVKNHRGKVVDSGSFDAEGLSAGELSSEVWEYVDESINESFTDTIDGIKISWDSRKKIFLVGRKKVDKWSVDFEWDDKSEGWLTVDAKGAHGLNNKEVQALEDFISGAYNDEIQKHWDNIFGDRPGWD